jgi:transposase
VIAHVADRVAGTRAREVAEALGISEKVAGTYLGRA